MRPKKIETNFAEPINETDIERIRESLSGRPRDLLFFDLATRTGLPASRLLKLRVKDLVSNETDFLVYANNKEYNLLQPLSLDPVLKKTFQDYLDETHASMDDYLFSSRKGGGPLTLSSLSRLVKAWFEQLDRKKPGGLLALRKAHRLHAQADYPPGKEAQEKGEAKPILPILKAIRLQEMVLEELQSAILSGRIAPGEKLLAEDIARKMGVSRTPVREALSRLEALGLVYPQKGGGSIVNDLSEKEMAEIIEIRLLLEITIAKHAVRTASEADFNELEKHLSEMVLASQRQSVDDYLKANQAFHYVIYRSAQRPFFLRLIEAVWHRLSPYLYIVMRRADEFDWEGDIAHHRFMLEGMRRRDTEMLCNWLSKDIKEMAVLVKTVFDENKRL